ncbi:flagellar basal-body rod protein FlgG [Cellvibrio zantedeschiae]|uniref:Flagellar basal-body rod protein FlgG n=1 Tax=Cellvibrio zantedeschiae TaxID=1237077 RepID=A0ABQ3B9N6_9GAMM|nr:flagellar hook-basal body protein [Cellvibrio zantedeschiae]GGY84976.1 flagellar basal-body rod protein FlgG [Cellvibrio zantedeschiae]
MLEILHISENGLKANQEWINSISHNVANMQTPGFKKASVGFSELISAGNIQHEPVQKSNFEGMGVSIANKATDFSKGDIKQTGKYLDVAVIGDGFIELETENGDLVYTKLGHLGVNADGRLVAHDGSLLSSDINIPTGNKGVRIAPNGLVSADMGDGNFLDVGSINIVRFNNPEYLQSIGNQIFQPTKQSGEAELESTSTSKTTLAQGFLEMSNVNLVDEMSDLLLAQRAYQLNARLIQTADQILETINNLRR